MKIWHTAALLGLALMLVGCSQQPAAKPASASHSQAAATTKSSTKSSTKPQAKKKMPAAAKEVTKLAWDQQKTAKLAAFMKQFGPAMKQVYVKADAQSHTQFQGDDLSAVIKAAKPVNLSGTTTKVTWLPAINAGSKTQPNIVAIYVDNTDKILYLFSLTAAGSAKVWVSQAEANHLVLTVKETANKDLPAAFTAIVKGQAVRAVASGSPATSSSTPTKATQVFNAQYQHTWYSFDGGQLSQLSFAANSMTYNGSKRPVYPITMRSAQDKKALVEDPSLANPARKNWYGAMPTKNVSEWLSLWGWYQSAGGANLYRIVTRQLNDRSVPVLETAYGADNWHDKNFYLDKTAAQQNRNVLFSDQHK